MFNTSVMIFKTTSCFWLKPTLFHYAARCYIICSNSTIKISNPPSSIRPLCSYTTGSYWFICHLRSVYKELHADHETGCWQQTAVCSRRGQHTACFVVRGFQRGLPLGTRLCSQSVVCYTLCRRCRENAVAAGEGKGIWSGRKAGLWLRGVEPQPQDWFYQQTGRIWKPSFLVPRRTSGQNIPNLWTHSRKNRRIFLSKLKWAGSRFRAFPPWLPFGKAGRDCQRRRMKCAVHLDRWLARLALLFPR